MSTIIVRYHHGGRFQFKKGKTEYEGGGVQLDTCVEISKLTFAEIKKRVRNLVVSDNIEVWYKLHGRTLTNGRRMLKGDSDIPSLIDSRNAFGCVSVYVLARELSIPSNTLSKTTQLIPVTNNVVERELLDNQPKQKPNTTMVSSPLRRSPRGFSFTSSAVLNNNKKQAFNSSVSQSKAPSKQPPKKAVKAKVPPKKAPQLKQPPKKASSQPQLSFDVLQKSGSRAKLTPRRPPVNETVQSKSENGVNKRVCLTANEELEEVEEDVEESEDEDFEDESRSDSELSDEGVEFDVNEEDRENEDDFVEETEQILNRSDKRKGKSVDEESVSEEDVDVAEECSDLSDDLRSLHGSDDEVDPHSTFNSTVDLKKKIVLKVGLQFSDIVELRKALKKHAIENGYDYYYEKNGCGRLRIKCRHKCECEWDVKRSKFPKCTCKAVNVCPFIITARKVKLKESYQIKRMKLEHTCSYISYNTQVTAEFLADKYLEDFRTHTSWKLKEFQRQVYKDLLVHVGYAKCWRARARAKLMLHGNGVDEYGRVWDYAHALKKYNPGSSAYVVVNAIDRAMPLFQRLYICLSPCKEGFLKGCRPIVGVDGCHLKGAFPGMCLVAVGKDGNNNIYPIAWAVVEVENGETWSWFLDLLLLDIGGGKAEGEGLTFMSDRQKGLLDALSLVAPKADLRFCVRHVWANFKLKFSGQSFKQYFWNAARASTFADFKFEMEGIKFLSADAYEYLFSIDPKHWSRHAFTNTAKSNMLTNNMCESFNSVLKDARDKPVLTHMEWMRRYVMKRSCEKRSGVEKFAGTQLPYVEKYFTWARDESRYCTLMGATDSRYEVEIKGDQHSVDLDQRTCTCNNWSLTGLPCVHAFASILKKRHKPEDYVDEMYSKATYKLAYEIPIAPMPGPKQWEMTEYPRPAPPPFRKLPGRPSHKKRRKEVGEGQVENRPQYVQRIKKKNKCGKCGELGHYKSTCKNTAPNTEQPVNKGGRPKSNSAWSVAVRKRAEKRKADMLAHANMISGLHQQNQPPNEASCSTSAPMTQESQANSRRQLQFDH